MTLFLDTLKSYRKGYYQQNGKFPKPDRKGMVWAYPWAIERQYSSYIQDYMKNITTLYGGWLEDNYELFVREVGSRADGLRHDEWYEEMDAWNEELREIQANNPDFRNKSMLAYLTTIGYTADDFNQAQFFKFAKQAIDSPFIPDEALTTPLVKAWAQNNRVLITSLSDEYIKKANLIVSDAVQNGMLYKDLTDELQKLDKNLGKTRARLIARDQIGKLNGNLSQDRSEAAGLDMYSWLTAKDERVRGNPGGKYPKAIPSHYIMEGKLCRWDNPTVWSLDKGETWINRDSRAPRVHPGQEIQCRCVQIPFWDEIVKQIDGEIIQELG